MIPFSFIPSFNVLSLNYLFDTDISIKTILFLRLFLLQIDISITTTTKHLIYTTSTIDSLLLDATTANIIFILIS